ncbi:uncharacterized protein MONOS_1206 [Monocercomonoides exilis]|uniref:uncharacterized protein n=1 Tax=Monocercomonoides exilis TaxID=2049356 RepID=UPI003559F4FD|nr:hypothetical protein MONOS_1206 [Monocercomonoides exilis]|eukprot:MONOS_1206.1-p1 / transcript=MONOS_1206.1 / gene=MONOS_1206 / organism=Monocercomonoides_exilis_PA203 / gene_product=unspecified product / transcript_product=unspecified product / location=Mono_scaffold00020:174444-175142(+) / protein_length=233 / sequence_SO=supercontig / SO=protein_coding / is_pseudo=false
MISKQDIGSKKHPLHCFLFSDDIKSMKNAGFIIVQCSTALYAERLALTHLLSSNTDFSELYKKRTEEAEESNNSPMHEQKLSRLSVLNELIVQFLFVCELDDSLSSLLTEGLMKEQLCNIVINAALNKNTEDVNLKARDLIRSISTQISSSLSTWKKFDSLRQMAKRKLDSGYEPKSSLDKDQKGKDEVNEESDLESEDEFLEFFTLLDSPPELESEEETTSEDDEYEDEGN